MQTNSQDQASYQANLYGTTVATMPLTQFFSQIYSTMALGVGLSAIISLMMAYIFPNNLIAMMKNPVFLIGLPIIEIILVFVLSAKSWKDSRSSIPLFFLFSALNGLTISSIFFVYASSTIALAFVSTIVMFLALSIYGKTTKRNLSGLGKACMAGLIGLIVLGLLSMIMSLFLHIDVTLMQITFSALGILIFSGLIAWDNQKIEYFYNSVNGQVTSGMAVQGALQLYLDFINLFLSIIRILGIFSSDSN